MLEDDLGERILDDAFGTKLFQIRDELASYAVLDDGFYGYPIIFRQAGNGRAAEGR